jgi:hypothetical protein
MAKTINLTVNEIDVLNGIAYHEMSSANTSKPKDISETGTYCWADDFSKTLTAAQVKGVLASLVKKRLIIISPYDGDTVVDFTPAGFAAFQQHDDNR